MENLQHQSHATYAPIGRVSKAVSEADILCRNREGAGGGGRGFFGEEGSAASHDPQGILMCREKPANLPSPWKVGRRLEASFPLQNRLWEPVAVTKKYGKKI